MVDIAQVDDKAENTNNSVEEVEDVEDVLNVKHATEQVNNVEVNNDEVENDEVENVEVEKDDLEVSQMEMGKYKCERIIWNPSMRNQFYYDENELYHDLLARLEMIKRTT